MKGLFSKLGSIVLFFSALSINSCEKEKVPILTTSPIANIEGTVAISGGTITSEGSGTVLSRGVCWSTRPTPTIEDNKTMDGAGAGTFTSTLTGLFGATTYYVRAYATNGSGVGYGMTMSFTTLGQAPTVSCIPATNITTTTATLNGTVNPNHLATVVTFEYGKTINYGNTATAPSSPITGNISTNINANITDLEAGTVYHYRIKTVNYLGTTYSSDISFTTLGQVPTANTTSVNTFLESAVVWGSVNANYLSTIVTFEYGLSTSYGGTATAIQSPVTGTTNTFVSATITGLSAGTLYHTRVKAVNSLGTTYGNDIAFSTLGGVPSASTNYATNINTASAQLNGWVNPNYFSTIITFEYGISTDYSNTIIAEQSPITESSFVSATITDLDPGTTYHYRIKAVNDFGTTYSEDFTFKTFETVSDIDGNIYKTIVIGTQTWLTENLKTTKYNDGTPIPNIVDDATWASLTTGAYGDFGNVPANSIIYGKLYNWYVVASTNPKNVCPVGWHVPADIEWTTLINWLGGESVAGGKLKESGTAHWVNTSADVTNESGFSALPGGYRDYSGPSFDIRDWGYWWTSTEYNSGQAWNRIMYSGYISVLRSDNTKNIGYSVRCVKDN